MKPCCAGRGNKDNRMDDHLLIGRLKELSDRTYQNDYLTHTDFLSAPELARAHDLAVQQRMLTGDYELSGVPYLTFGGWDDAERRCIVFLPSYMDRDGFIHEQEQEPSVVSCILCEPVNRHFADRLTHRDFLGALMNLGIERDKTGDILTDGTSADIFTMTDIAEYICDNLLQVRHTMVRCRQILLTEAVFRPQYQEIEGNVASERLDSVLAMLYHFSRNKSKELIEQGLVTVNGRTAYSGGYDLTEGADVSVRGYGRFVYEGVTNVTGKGRCYVRLKVFH